MKWASPLGGFFSLRPRPVLFVPPFPLLYLLHVTDMSMENILWPWVPILVRAGVPFVEEVCWARDPSELGLPAQFWSILRITATMVQIRRGKPGALADPVACGVALSLLHLGLWTLQGRWHLPFFLAWCGPRVCLFFFFPPFPLGPCLGCFGVFFCGCLTCV